jgi:mannosyl-oligosaccharide alpha-1,2-mannosidase
MYRITGDSKWRELGWMMWENIENFCQSPSGEFASMLDVTKVGRNADGNDENFVDVLESFWFSETLKYFYLLFEDVSVWSLDEFVYNTEAHPFKLA